MSDAKKSSTELATKWNVRHQYSKDQNDLAPTAASVLVKHVEFLPVSGEALDLAAGRGGNARLLHEHQLNTHAWDLSAVAMQELQAELPSIHTSVRNVVEQPPEPNSFDVIVVSRFLDRSICPAIEAALRLNGVLFYQTFTQGLSNPDFLLRPNELIRLFPNLHVQFYLEPSDGSEAQLVATRLNS